MECEQHEEEGKGECVHTQEGVREMCEGAVLGVGWDSAMQSEL